MSTPSRGPRKRPPKFKNLDEGAPKPEGPGLDSKATITIEGQEFVCEARDLETLCVLGRGAFGVVEKVRHRPTGTTMAVKRIASSAEDHKKLLMELDVSMRSATCPYTAHFFGALFCEGDVWICMEIMDVSLDNFYPRVFINSEVLRSGKEPLMPEPFLGVVSCSVLKGLHYLASELHVMHRDVKPSNILVDRKGKIKLCDFGISGQLVDSLAKTMSAGCKPYMGPERIDPSPEYSGYDVRSDIWSFGITTVEVATGRYPYGNFRTPFDQLKAVVNEAAPTLPETFSEVFRNFVAKCLSKNLELRPKYPVLLEHDFITTHMDSTYDVAGFVCQVLSTSSPEAQ